jgi:hypothetical protein
MLRTIIAILALAGVLFAAGCNDDDDDRTTPTSERAASVTADSGATALIDQVVGAVSSGDAAKLEALLVYHTETCTTTPPGGGGPPVCATTEPDGTELEGITTVACESEFVRRDDLNLDSALASDLTFFGAYSFDGFPDGAEHIIIFERASPVGGSNGMGYVVNDAGIVALQYGCGWSIENFIESNNLGTPIATPN